MLVAERLLAVLDVAAVGAVLDAGGARLGGRRVGRALAAEGLLRLVLVAAAWARAALVERRVEEGARLADGQRAVAARVRARRRRREAVGAALAGQVQPLGPVRAERAGHAVAVDAELLPVAALLAALLGAHRLLGPRRQPDTAQPAAELALLALVNETCQLIMFYSLTAHRKFQYRFRDINFCSF